MVGTERLGAKEDVLMTRQLVGRPSVVPLREGNLKPAYAGGMLIQPVAQRNQAVPAKCG
jgi:hypothetical protein